MSKKDHSAKHAEMEQAVAAAVKGGTPQQRYHTVMEKFVEHWKSATSDEERVAMVNYTISRLPELEVGIFVKTD